MINNCILYLCVIHYVVSVKEIPFFLCPVFTSQCSFYENRTDFFDENVSGCWAFFIYRKLIMPKRKKQTFRRTEQITEMQIKKVVNKNVQEAKQKGGRLTDIIKNEFYLLFHEHIESFVELYRNPQRGSPPSPIEELFIAAFRMIQIRECAFEKFHLYHNYEIKVYGEKFYRVDFVIKDEEDNFHKRLIELDSHIWHEKTPQQAEHDKKRERELRAAGYDLIRFAGREVYIDPIEVVGECLQFNINLWRKNLLERTEQSNG